MKISINRFHELYYKKVDNSEMFSSGIYPTDASSLILGELQIMGVNSLPVYNSDQDNWCSFDKDENIPDSSPLDLGVHIYDNGKAEFSYLGDMEPIQHFYLYSHCEFIDFVSVLPLLSNQALNMPVSFKNFKLNTVIADLYITIFKGNEIKFLKLNRFKEAISEEMFNKTISEIFENGDFIVDECEGGWEIFCRKYKLDEIDMDEKLENIPILYLWDEFTNCSTKLNSNLVGSVAPCLGFTFKKEFSCQYFFDYLGNSQNGSDFILKLKEALLSNKSINEITVVAPSNFISQIKYSIEFRLQYEDYKSELSHIENHLNKDVIDLKNLYKNRREDIKQFILDAKNASFLDTIKNPLPYNLEKNYRSYVRATGEFDRLNYAGKLFSLFLKSILLYPLEELIYLGHKENPEIKDIIATITSDKPISDGTWLSMFNNLATCINKNASINISYFQRLVKTIQSKYKDLVSIIPTRNDWAHYREHSAIFMNLLDKFLPELLKALRDSLEGNLFITVDSQNHLEDGLYITAKKIMGYEVDIETIEFKTILDGRNFIKNKLLVYNSKINYTVPLQNYFSVEIVPIDAIRMGVLGKVSNGQVEFEY